jgi:hypothetical protein
MTEIRAAPLEPACQALLDSCARRKEREERRRQYACQIPIPGARPEFRRAEAQTDIRNSRGGRTRSRKVRDVKIAYFQDGRHILSRSRLLSCFPHVRL